MKWLYAPKGGLVKLCTNFGSLILSYYLTAIFTLSKDRKTKPELEKAVVVVGVC